MRRHMVMALLMAVVLPAAAQDAPEVDLTDPAAVAQAYMTACREGDAETALSLLDPQDAALPALKGMAEQLARQPNEMPQFATMMREYLFLPMGMDWGVEIGEGAAEGDETRVGFEASMAVQGQLVLGRQEDGTWRVKLIDSMRASAPDGRSFMAEQLATQGGPGGGGAGGQHQSRQNMQALAQGLHKYANDHAQQLPPAETWMDELEDYLLDHTVFECPSPEDKPFGYAMNEALSGAALPTDWNERRDIILLAEWPDAERNAHAPLPPETEPASPWEDDTVLLATADGQVVSLQSGQTLASIREAERASETCQQHINQLARAAREYALDHDGLLPAADTWEEDLAPYIQPEQVHRSGRRTDWASRDNLRELYKAFNEYADDHDRTWPDATQWVDEIMPYVADADLLKCPALPDNDYGYAMNVEVSGQPVRQDWRVRQQTLLLFEWASGEKNAHAAPLELIEAERPQPSGVLVLTTEGGQETIVPAGITFDELLEADEAYSTCSGHLTRLVAAIRKYSRDNDGVFPAADTWQDDIALYLLQDADLADIYTCPAAPELEFAYAYNEAAADKRLTDLPARGDTILLFESDIDEANAHGTPPKGDAAAHRHMARWNDGGGLFGLIAKVNGNTHQGSRQVHAEPAAGALERLLVCPAAEGVERAYAYNRELAGKKAADLADHDQQTLFFESDLNAPNAAGDPDTEAAARHSEPREMSERLYSHVGLLSGGTRRVYEAREDGP